MAEMEIIYTQEAVQDLLSVADYHFDKVGEASAVQIVEALQEHIEKLAQFPHMGEEHPDAYLNALGFRKLVHGNHIVIYKAERTEVIVERIVWASSNYPELFR